MAADDHRGVEVAHFPDGVVDQHAADGVYLGHLAAGDEADHVEVVDGHVAEDAAGFIQVHQRRGLGVAAGHPHQMDVAYLS